MQHDILDWKQDGIGAVVQQREKRHEPEVRLVAVLDPGPELIHDVPDGHAIPNSQTLVPDAVRLSQPPFFLLQNKTEERLSSAARFVNDL